MASRYNCSTCPQTFTTKVNQAKHTCDKVVQPNVNINKKLTRDDLANIFNFCLDTLRTEHLVGDKALRSLAYLLDLKLLEPHINSNIINIDSYDFSSGMNEYEIDKEREKKLLLLTRFSNLAKDDQNNLSINLKYIWAIILSVHPLTRSIFMKGKGFDIQHTMTFKKLIDRINSINFDDVDIDVLGEAYEEVIKNIMTGKILGQFFTPPVIKNIMIKLVDPRLNPDGTIETIFDPAMGTGGFLISSIRHLIKQSKDSNININWNFVSTQGIGGREAEPDTYQLAISNMLISSGHTFSTLENGDSIRTPITSKYDIVLANPPFGIDGLNYPDIIKMFRLNNDYLPIRSNSAVPLFLQIIIYILKIDGRCAMVFPDGKELFSKSHELVTIRKFLMKTCDLKEIIHLPSGIFTHTGMKTCILYFHKKKLGSDILTQNIKYKENKEIARTYAFANTHQTHTVKFFEYNQETNEKKILSSVTIDDIANNNYSLNYSDYSKSKLDKLDFQPDIKLMKLDDICQFLQKSKRHASYGKDTGKYKFYTSSTKIKFCPIADYSDQCIIIGSGGNPNIKLDSNFSCSSDNFILKSKDPTIDIKYLYYYLNNNINILANGFVGATIKHISKDYISKILIPIPSLENQKIIILNYESTKIATEKLRDDIDKKNNDADMFMDNIIKKQPVAIPDESIKCIKPEPTKCIQPEPTKCIQPDPNIQKDSSIKPPPKRAKKPKRGLIIVE